MAQLLWKQDRISIDSGVKFRKAVKSNEYMFIVSTSFILLNSSNKLKHVVMHFFNPPPLLDIKVEPLKCCALG